MVGDIPGFVVPITAEYSGGVSISPLFNTVKTAFRLPSALFSYFFKGSSAAPYSFGSGKLTLGGFRPNSLGGSTRVDWVFLDKIA